MIRDEMIAGTLSPAKSALVDWLIAHGFSNGDAFLIGPDAMVRNARSLLPILSAIVREQPPRGP